MVNDKSEYFYAWGEIQKAAFKYALERLPMDLIRPDNDVDATTKVILEQMRDQLTSTDGYGHLFVTSFAFAKTADQEKNGILTLWDRYTKLKGYCLQFEKADVEHMVRLDSMSRNYAWVALSPVIYGVDQDTFTFRELARQVGEQQLLQIARQTRDGRIPVRYEDHWAPSYLERKLMDYCGIHKHPGFEDEREFRIQVYPLEQADARVFTGIATRKTIHKGPNGKKYLVMGDSWRPCIEPKRIIIGPKADPNIELLLNLFKHRPAVSVCDIPII
ncbi:DUF2971 domain-containing protein [Microvirga sp. 2YAF29]|uniref:DUF2971 domain-containing protein n=1 Tax=Microvirga sp. 2YAF29 TaxID=3233031 RepID=UPI003F9DF4D1